MTQPKISIVRLTPTPYAAVVVGRMTPAELVRRWGTNSISSAVYDAQESGALPKGGHNIWMYRNQIVGGEADIEIGMQMPAKFADFGEVVCRETPAGEVAAAAHFGEYSDVGKVHGAVIDYVQQSGRLLAGVSWEVYGDWENDPSKRRTDVYHLLEPT